MPKNEIFTMVRLSVIIPTYKPQDYLWDCLSSLEKQTLSFESFEILLILNGPQSPFEEIILQYLSKHPLFPCNLIYSEESGVSSARNLGLDMSRGEFITFIDDDDIVSPVYLEELLSVSTPSVIGISNTYGFIDNPIIHRPFRLEKAYQKIPQNEAVTFIKARKFFSGPCMKSIHRDIIGRHRFDPRFKNGEDSLFMFQISNRFKYVRASSSDAIYYRRFRENSAMTSQSSRMIIWNRIEMMFEYVAIYIKKPFEYSSFFFLTRILAAGHTILWEGILHKGEQ